MSLTQYNRVINVENVILDLILCIHCKVDNVVRSTEPLGREDTKYPTLEFVSEVHAGNHLLNKT